MAAKEAQKQHSSPPRGPTLGLEDQKRLFQTLFFMNNADVNVIRGLVEKLSSKWTEYPEFLAWAILSKKKAVVEFLLDDGANLHDPPTTLTRDLIGLGPEIAEALQNYRRKPFLILAASSSSWEVVELLLARGESLQEVGFVGLSKTRLNAVVSNALGAAAFYGRKDVVAGLLQRVPRGDPALEFRTIEEKTISKSKSAMVREYKDCTPFLLSVYRGETPEVTCQLMDAGCQISAVDWQGNSALHIAAACNKPEHVKALLQRKCDVMTARNSKGETPASIATAKGYRDLLALIGHEDTSGQAAAKLLDDLMAEEEKKQKKKSKKQRRQEPAETSKQPEAPKEPEAKKEPSPPRSLKVVQLPPYRKPENPVAEEPAPVASPEPKPEQKKKPEEKPRAPVEEAKVPPKPQEPQGLLTSLLSVLGRVTASGDLQAAGPDDLKELKRLLQSSLDYVSQLS